jgi:hypothetical protein
MTELSRARVVSGAAILAGVAAAGAFYGASHHDAAPSTVAPVASRMAEASPASDRPARPGLASSAAPVAGSGGSTAQASAEQGPAAQGRASAITAARAAEPPRFDIVRMGVRGMVVVAGRAAPGAEVLLYEGRREIGRARADGRGEWVILPADPLGAGARELSLRARSPGGEEIAGPDTVLVVGPATEPPVAQAGAGKDHSEQTRASVEASPARGEPQAEGTAGTAPSSPEQNLVLLLPPTATAAPRALSYPAAGEGPARLGLDVVDYDDSDTMRFAGTAPPGARLRVYADNRHLGDAEADSSGRWSLTPAEAPAVGRHLLRVDQLGAPGPARVRLVSGRIEVAFQRESLPAGALRDGRVVVQPGNSLWRIARQAYGRGIRYTVIYRANQGQIREPDRIFPGQVFALPGAP